MAGHRSISPASAPASVNYITANTKATGQSKPQPATKRPPTSSKQGKRSHLKSKVKKAFTPAKKTVKTISALCFPESNDSDSSSGSSSRRSQVRVSFLSVASTPSICLTKPTYRGLNVRLSLHQPPQPPEIPQTLLLAETEVPQNANGYTNRKSTRFHHPVVSDVVASCGDPEELSRSSGGSGNIRPGTASTLGTIDFQSQVNPKRVFRNSQVSNNTQSFETFKNVMDGVQIKSPPREAAKALVSLPATVPSLPYIAMAPAMVLEASRITFRSNLETQSREQGVPTAATHAPAILVIPSVLAPGSEQPLPRPRLRHHTTNELLPGTNFLPYLPYNPRFNPYSATTTTANSPAPTPISQKRHSPEDLASTFAEAEAAEQAAIHDRHTTLYAAVESGSLASLVATSTVTAGPSTAKAPVSTANAAPSSTDFYIKRKPVPRKVHVDAPKPCTSKPLPPIPAPTSPRRFTYGIVPAGLQKDENGYSLPKKPSPAPKKAWWRSRCLQV